MQTLARLRHSLRNYLDRQAGDFGIAFKSLATGANFYYHADDLFPAASVIKLGIAIALWQAFECGNLNPGQRYALTAAAKVTGAGVLRFLQPGLQLSLKDLAVLMLTISDNVASNILIDFLGLPGINDCLTTAGLTRSVLGRKFMTEPDSPIVKNFITAREIAQLLEKLYLGKLLSPAGTRELLDLLAQQQFNEMLPWHLPENLTIAHKTGEISGVRHDAGIFLPEGRPYILCAFSRNLPVAEKGMRAIARVSKTIYDFVTRG